VKGLAGGIVLALLFLVVLLPVLIVRGCGPPLPPGAPEPSGMSPPVALKLAATGAVVRLDMEDYLAGVVAAEMPARFHLEALKAQAVAARTYVAQRMHYFGGPGNRSDPRVDVTDDPRTDQAWLSQADLRRRWGLLGYWRYWSRVRRAVAETDGLVLTSNNTLIDAVYHSTCGGATEDAVFVWGNEFSYLKSVECPYDKHSRHYRTDQVLSLQETARLLGLEPPPDDAAGFIEVLQTSPSGRALSVRVGDRQFTAADLRVLLDLNSTAFTVEAVDAETLVFHVRGYGHGAGLCQYGADGMAREGHTFDEILQHYYTGVELSPLGDLFPDKAEPFQG